MEDKTAAQDQFTILATHYDELMDVVPYESWVEYVMLLWELAEVKPRRVLDCACGTGNVSFELARQGYDVMGVDLSSDMIVSAQRKVEAEAWAGALPLRFLQSDLTNFDLGEKFDGGTCLFDSLNYILDPEKLQQAFAQIAKHMETGGVFIFDFNTPYAFEANLFTQRSRDPRRNLHYDWRANYNPETRICEVTMLFERHTQSGIVQAFSEVHHERSYSRAEITAMLVQTGWRLLKVYDAYTTNPPHDRSERWYFVAEKV